jgi:type I restriction enzyme S subunit
MSFGRPYILNIDGAIHDGWASISNFENILISDFLYYYLTSKSVQFFWNNKINSGSVSNLNANIIKSLPVPIPPLSKQKEIVEILDKFDALVNDISQGLPAEIEARRKQYEYYREKLLTFKARTT